MRLYREIIIHISPLNLRKPVKGAQEGITVDR